MSDNFFHPFSPFFLVKLWIYQLSVSAWCGMVYSLSESSLCWPETFESSASQKWVITPKGLWEISSLHWERYLTDQGTNLSHSFKSCFSNRTSKNVEDSGSVLPSRVMSLHDGAASWGKAFVQPLPQQPVTGSATILVHQKFSSVPF